MDTKSLAYYAGVILVAATTFLFIEFIFPSLPPLLGYSILIAMILLVTFAFSIRIWRWRMVSKENQVQKQHQADMTTMEYIKQAEKLMGKK